MLKRLAFTSWTAGVGIAIAWAGSFGAAEFPAKATYLFFVQGTPAGKSEIECVQKDGAYVFSSTSSVVHGEFAETLSCRTEFDQKTLRPRLFQYKGVLSGESLSGTIRVDGDSAFSDVKTGANSFSVRVRWTDPTLVFQNYVPEHLVVLAHHLAASETLAQRFTILFPSDMMFVPGAAEVASEVELATRPSPAVCRKFVVAFQSSLPFYLYVDRKRNLPVYMDFPGVQTEMFLQSAFGDHPGTKYTPPKEPGTAR
jgi:hypothetical protein